jgi:hypothetical protein
LRRAVLLALGALLASLIFASVASATTGTWEQYPSGGTEYKAQVQQPINTANTSNWSSKSKGGIPVMFKLFSKSGAAAFESIGSDTNTDNDYAYVSFTPDASLMFKDVHQLSTDYAFTLGDCHKGALRWSVRTSANESLFIYYGDEPNTTDCTTHSQGGTNMIGLSDLRYDTSQYPGGTFYDTYDHALELMGSQPIIRVSLVLDGGWGGDQRATITNTTVNDAVYDFNTGGSGTFAPTCDLPDATIEVGKADSTASGDVNEATVQGSLADSGNHLRVVDCKYQYILSIPSLKGAGTYRVTINDVDGHSIPTPDSNDNKVKFDLK